MTFPSISLSEPLSEVQDWSYYFCNSGSPDRYFSKIRNPHFPRTLPPHYKQTIVAWNCADNENTENYCRNQPKISVKTMKTHRKISNKSAKPAQRRRINASLQRVGKHVRTFLKQKNILARILIWSHRKDELHWRKWLFTMMIFLSIKHRQSEILKHIWALSLAP